MPTLATETAAEFSLPAHDLMLEVTETTALEAKEGKVATVG